MRHTILPAFVYAPHIGFLSFFANSFIWVGMALRAAAFAMSRLYLRFAWYCIYTEELITRCYYYARRLFYAWRCGHFIIERSSPRLRRYIYIAAISLRRHYICHCDIDYQMDDRFFAATPLSMFDSFAIFDYVFTLIFSLAAHDADADRFFELEFFMFCHSDADMFRRFALMRFDLLFIDTCVFMIATIHFLWWCCPCRGFSPAIFWCRYFTFIFR